MIEHHRHKSGVGLRITTHEAGQRFGTFARVALAKTGEQVHESATLGFGMHEPAIAAARKWIDAQKVIDIPKSA